MSNSYLAQWITSIDEILRLRERLVSVKEERDTAKWWSRSRHELLTRYRRTFAVQDRQIDDLMDKLAAVEAERDALREQLTHQTITLTAEHQRAERTLAALLEPSAAVIVACAKALRQHHEGVEWCTWEALKEQTRERMMDEVRVVLSAAFAAAEKEVQGA